MVAAPPSPILGERLKNWGGPEQKIKFGGVVNLRKDLKFLGRPMIPNDVMVVVLKDILLC